MQASLSGHLGCLGECMVELRQEEDGRLSLGRGGDTLNTAVYMARLGASVSYVTALGDDSLSDDMIAAWQAEGVGTERVRRVPSATPGLYMIRLDEKGERSFTYWRDSAPVRRLFDPEIADETAAALLDLRLVYISGITLGLFTAEARGRLFAALRAVRARGGLVAFDTNFRPRAWPDRRQAVAAFSEALTVSDIVLGGLEDYRLLCEPIGEVSDMAAWIRAAGVREMVVRRLVPGSLIVTPDGEAEVTHRATKTVVDTTAAGDSFAAAYLVARLSGATGAEAATAGHRLADIVIRHRGAIIPRAETPSGVWELLGERR